MTAWQANSRRPPLAAYSYSLQAPSGALRVPSGCPIVGHPPRHSAKMLTPAKNKHNACLRGTPERAERGRIESYGHARNAEGRRPASSLCLWARTCVSVSGCLDTGMSRCLCVWVTQFFDFSVSRCFDAVGSRYLHVSMSRNLRIIEIAIERNRLISAARCAEWGCAPHTLPDLFIKKSKEAFQACRAYMLRLANFLIHGPSNWNRKARLPAKCPK